MEEVAAHPTKRGIDSVTSLPEQPLTISTEDLEGPLTVLVFSGGSDPPSCGAKGNLFLLQQTAQVFTPSYHHPPAEPNTSLSAIRTQLLGAFSNEPCLL